MALTTLDTHTALIIIDLQHGIVRLPVVHEPQPVIDRCAQLAAGFRARQLPVVLVNVAGGAPGRNEQGSHSGELPADWPTLGVRWIRRRAVTSRAATAANCRPTGRRWCRR